MKKANFQIKIQYWKSPVGELVIGSFQDELCLCDWRYRKMRDSVDKRILKSLGASFYEATSPVILETIKQLQEYFNRERMIFEIPLKLVGSEFQVKVWKLLQAIPFGETQTYKDLSINYGNLKAIRAVASANGANALAVIIPCHRIIGSNQELVGYAGGLKAKEKLLLLEGAINSDQLKLFV